MKLKEKLEFLRAGYTRKEIEAMEEAEKNEDPVSAEDPKPAEDPVPAEDPKPDYDEIIKGVNGRIDDLIKVIQESNILTDGKETDPVKTGVDTVKDILGGK